MSKCITVRGHQQTQCWLLSLAWISHSFYWTVHIRFCWSVTLLNMADEFSWYITTLREFITVTSHGYHTISNYRQLDCLFDSLFRLTAKRTPKHRITGPLDGNPTVTSGFPTQRASYEDLWSFLVMMPPYKTYIVFKYPSSCLQFRVWQWRKPYRPRESHVGRRPGQR